MIDIIYILAIIIFVILCISHPELFFFIVPFFLFFIVFPWSIMLSLFENDCDRLNEENDCDRLNKIRNESINDITSIDDIFDD